MKVTNKNWKKSLKIISFSVVIVFFIHLYILPSLYPLTIEEQAGRNTRDTVSSDEDEFIKKTPSRRSYAGGSEVKEPRLACLLSLIIPGGGHIYLKKDIKGIVLFSLTFAGYSAAGYYAYKALTGDEESAEKRSKILISGLFFIMGLVFHIVGIVEAYNDAIEINEKNYYFGGYSKVPYIARFVEQ